MVLAVGGHFLQDLPACCLRMATPFGGGIAGTREDLCGALSGGLLVIGAIYGRSDPTTSRDRVYGLAKSFRSRFYRRFDAMLCQPLYDQRHAPGTPNTCRYLLEETALMLMDVLTEERRRTS